jgi:hypothetical protein
MSPLLVLPVILVALSLDPQAAPPPPAAPPQAAPAPAPTPAPKGFAGVDLFGTSRFTVEKLLEPVHDRFIEYERLSVADQFEEAAKIQQELETALKQSGGFAFLKFSMIRYFRDGDPRYLTIDVVEPADAERRMSFAKPPADATAFPDPEGLIAKYGEYETKGFELLRLREPIEDAASTRELFHCPFGFSHPQLGPYKAVLVDGARKHADELFAIVHRDKDAQHRAQAIFLLGFTSDGARLVREITPACRDENANVRNNAMRVFAVMAQNHSEVELPLAPVLDMLDFPATTDRNKAAAVLSALSKKRELAPEIRRRCGQTLVAMLRLKQPNNHDYALMILRELRGEKAAPLAADDYAGWEAWLAGKG